MILRDKIIWIIAILGIIGLCIGWYQVVDYREDCIPEPDEYFVNGYDQKIYIYKDYCNNDLPNGTPGEILRE